MIAMNKECLVVAHNTANGELNLQWISKQNQWMEPMMEDNEQNQRMEPMMEDNDWITSEPHGQRLIMKLQKQIGLLLDKVKKHERHIQNNITKSTEPKKQQNQKQLNKYKLKTKVKRDTTANSFT